MKHNTPTAPRFDGRRPASESSSRTKRATPRSDTRPELLLRKALWRCGLRYRLKSTLPGKPDLVFPKERVAVFCDGDFWHGRDWSTRRAKLARGTNAEYWIAKIEANRKRDARTNELLRVMGWTVLRFWETDILAEPETAVLQIAAQVRPKRERRQEPQPDSTRSEHAR